MQKQKEKARHLALWVLLKPEHRNKGQPTITLKDEYKNQKQRDKILMRYKFLAWSKYEDKAFQIRIYENGNELEILKYFTRDGEN